MKIACLGLRPFTLVLAATSLIMTAFATVSTFPTDPRDVDAGNHCSTSVSPEACCNGACYELHKGAPQHEQACEVTCVNQAANPS